MHNYIYLGVHLVKAMVFLVVMYRYESWTIKKAEHWKIILLNCGATEESRLDSKEIKLVNPKGNQPWIFTGRTDAQLKLQYFGHLMWGANSLKKTLMLRKTEGRRRREWQRMRCLGGITNSMDVSLSRRWWKTGKPGMLQSMGSQRVGRDWMTEQVVSKCSINTYWKSK